MSLKILSFEKGIFKSDIRRFWIVGLIYSALMFFSTFFDFYVNKSVGSVSNADTLKYTACALYNNSFIAHFFGILTGVLLAVILFAFLNSPSALSFYHGLPLRRRTIYISKLASAFAILTVPVLAVTCIVLISKLFGSNINVQTSHLMLWAAIQLLYSYMGFACMVFTAMLSGNILAHFALTGICLILPVIIVSFIDNIMSAFLYGYSGTIDSVLSYIYIMPPQIVTAKCLIYIFAVILLLTASYFLYKNRALERNGEAYVFISMKNIFVGAAALLGGIFGYWYFSIWFDANILFMLPFGIISLIIANMINKKKLTFKGVPLYAAVFTVFVLALFGGFKFDISGYERRVPDIDKVMSVTVKDNIYYEAYDTPTVVSYDPKAGNDLYEKFPEKYDITKREDIEKIIAFHKYRTKNHSSDNAQNTIILNYTLKNGKHMKRSYFFSHNEDKQYLEPLSDIEAWTRQRYIPYKNKNAEITSLVVGTLMQNLDNNMRLTFSSDSKEFEGLKNALIADIETLPYDYDATLYRGNSNAPAYITVHYVSPLVYRDGSDYTDWQNIIRDNTYAVTDGFKNTLAFLHGIEEFNAIDFTSDKIKSIGIADYDVYKGGGTLRFGEDFNVSEIITDRAEIDAIVNRLKSGYKDEFADEEVRYTDYIIETFDEKFFPVSGRLYNARQYNK